MNANVKHKLVRAGQFCVLLCMVLTSAGCSESTQTEEDGLDHYTLSTEFLPNTVFKVDSAVLFGFETRVQNNRNQEWIFAQNQDGSYRITNRAFGETLALDVVNDGVFETLILAPADNVSGQQWQVTPLDNGYCRLTNAFLGAEIALDVTSDQDQPTVTMRPIGNFSGQHWSFRQQGFQSPMLDDLCAGE